MRARRPAGRAADTKKATSTRPSARAVAAASPPSDTKVEFSSSMSLSVSRVFASTLVPDPLMPMAIRLPLNAVSLRAAVAPLASTQTGS